MGWETIKYVCDENNDISSCLIQDIHHDVDSHTNLCLHKTSACSHLRTDLEEEDRKDNMSVGLQVLQLSQLVFSWSRLLFFYSFI
jgi:hypothetical protein